ncbi:MAG: DNA-processing protein DprA [Candidatus Zixiibacteriota bacterium]
MTNSEIKDRLTSAIALLNVPGVGRARYSKLIKAFGDTERVVNAPHDQIAEINGISRGQASTIKKEIDFEGASQTAARIVQLGWAVLFQSDSDYPFSLKQIPDPPPILFRLGESHLDDDKLIAIVGTRLPSESGRNFAFYLASKLAQEGIMVVSGMAEGIDSAAHRGALDGGGKTIAVWGSSLDVLYPPSNKTLAETIKQNGAIYSEYFPETHPDRAFFPERNRIISGLSVGTVVIEAGEKSGALITAKHALDQGRDLFAVPGPPDSTRSKGVNNLIKKGARLLTSADDIFEEIPQLKGEILVKKFKKLPDLTDPEKKIIELFADGPLQIDQLSRGAALTTSETMEYLFALEIKGVVRELPGKRFVLSEEFQ